jgi:hypothetical protein
VAWCISWCGWLLDLLDGALYYRLLWRGERLARAEVEPLVDTVLAGFLPERPRPYDAAPV